MEQRQNNGNRCRIVRQVVSGLIDETERAVCALYQCGYDDGEVCKKLELSWRRLVAIKLKLALELINAGIRLPKEA